MVDVGNLLGIRKTNLFNLRHGYGMSPKHTFVIRSLLFLFCFWNAVNINSVISFWDVH